MVSTEYPPMPGGVGRYTANLTKALRKLGIDVQVACNEKGDGQYFGLSPKNTGNSEVLLKLVQDIKPDVVHIQFEPGLYGLILDPKDPRKSGTYIDSFYMECKTPIVTTFHTAYKFEQWIGQATIIKKTGRTGRFGIPARAAMRTWKYFLNYRAFNELNRDKFRRSKAGICFSKFLTGRVGGGHVIYHGADPATLEPIDKKHARANFSLPLDKRIALAVGFMTVTKGWDILEKMNLPEGWIIVINSSKSHYNVENLDIKFGGNHIIDLHRGHLSEDELTLLFYSADAVLLPYKVTAASGVMFDALAHGLPFVSTKLDFFKEFAEAGLGVMANRTSEDFSKGLATLDRNYERYRDAARAFSPKLRWDFVATQHAAIYRSVVAGAGPEDE
jgi:glycosyltransferase involved in cell wall biosynthesis